MPYVIAILLSVFLPLTAFGKWYEASSDHFIVYANDSEKNIHLFSQQLEQYHAALASITSISQPKPSPSNRVTVFALKNRRAVAKLYGDGGKYIGGFYIPRAGASVAIVPRIKAYSKETDFSMVTLMHEYAHHFMISNSEFVSPRWVSEGVAEFLSSAKFSKDGTLSIGRPAAHRASELLYSTEVTIEALLDPDTYEKMKKNGYDSFYGKSWLLYHYLVFSEKRRGQMAEYLNQIMAGKSSLEAGKEVFGSLSELEDDLDSYLKQRTMAALFFKQENLKIGEISVRRLREGEAKIMNVRIRSRRGVTREQALELVNDAREIAAQYPDDPVVMAALAEAEFDSGYDDAAIIAADAAIAGDQGQVDAYVQKGYAMFRQALDAEDPDAAYEKAFAPFLALNKIENDHPLPLIYFYKSYNVQGKVPPELAVQGLERALDIAPFDTDLRMSVVLQQVRDQRYDWVRRNLLPIAFNPHDSELSLVAKKAIAWIDRGSFDDSEALISILQSQLLKNTEEE